MLIVKWFVKALGIVAPVISPSLTPGPPFLERENLMSIITRRENRLRAAARKQGCRIIKSRQRKPGDRGFGLYDLRRMSSGMSVFGGHPGRQPIHSLDAIAVYLTEHAAPMSQVARARKMSSANIAAENDERERQQQAA